MALFCLFFSTFLIFASLTDGLEFDPSARVVEVAIRFPKPGMEEEFQVARKNMIDLVRSKEGCLTYREFVPFEGTFDELPGGPFTLPDLGETVYMMMMEYTNQSRFVEISQMPDVLGALHEWSPFLNPIAFLITQPVDPDFDVGAFGQNPSTVSIQLVRTVEEKLAESTEFEILFSPLEITDLEGLHMWVEEEEATRKEDSDTESCVACMRAHSEF